MSTSPPINEELSERELEILRLVATGASNKQIAQQLNISANTVKVHLRNIFAKTGAASRTEATLYAIRAGLVQVEGTPAAEALTTPAPAEQPQVVAPEAWWRRPWVIVLAVVALASAVLVAINVDRFRPANFEPLAAAAATHAPTATLPSRWQTRAPMPTARSGFAIAAYANRIYAIGGETAQGMAGAVECYDPADNAWVTLVPKPNPVTDVGAVVIGGQIYVPGGCLASGVTTNTLEVYDPRENRWETHASLPVALCAYAIATFEGKLYLFGGWDGRGYVASVYEYDPGQDAWRTRTPMPTARGNAGAAVAGGKIYVIGGTDGKQALVVNEEYLPERDDGYDNPWVQRAPLPVGRAGMGIASVADIIHIVGGEGKDGLLPPVEYFPQRDEWQPFENPMPEQWSNLGLVAVETRLYGIGGRRENAVTAQNLAYQAIYTIVIPIR